MVNKSAKIFVAGHRGMVGSAIMRTLNANGYTNCFGVSSKELDLKNQQAVNDYFSAEKPEIVIDSAAKVGGILANSTYPYEFLMENMLIQNNLITASLKYDVNKFVFLGSSCIYPKHAPQPLKEEYLLTSDLEPTNKWYAIAKISGVMACEAVKVQYGKDFTSLMPTNLYGEFDNFDLKNSHVIPALIRKFHEAKINNHDEVVVWGSGSPFREFLHVNDLAKAVLFSVENVLPEHLYNVGSGSDITIKELAELVQRTVGFNGKITWDSSKPDGTPRKLMDVSKFESLGWKPEISLEIGMASTYQWFLENIDNYRGKK